MTRTKISIIRDCTVPGRGFISACQPNNTFEITVDTEVARQLIRNGDAVSLEAIATAEVDLPDEVLPEPVAETRQEALSSQEAAKEPQETPEEALDPRSEMSDAELRRKVRELRTQYDLMTEDEKLMAYGIVKDIGGNDLAVFQKMLALDAPRAKKKTAKKKAIRRKKAASK